jgi:hypothetical protein
MGTKVKELKQASLSVPPCNGNGCCSTHRRKDRVYEDQVWRFANKTGLSPWRESK